MSIEERANAWLVDDTDCYYSKSGCGQTAEIIRDLLAENERLSALAAQHLADQELLVGRERKRVARECAEMCEPWGVADRIRTRYGVEEP